MPAARLSVSRTQVCVGGHPESTTVPVGCQAVGLVKDHLCWLELAPFGLSDDFECSVLTVNTKLLSSQLFKPLFEIIFLIFKRNHSPQGCENTGYRLGAPEKGMMED